MLRTFGPGLSLAENVSPPRFAVICKQILLPPLFKKKESATILCTIEMNLEDKRMASGLIGNEVPLSWGCEFESRVLRFYLREVRRLPFFLSVHNLVHILVPLEFSFLLSTLIFTDVTDFSLICILV